MEILKLYTACITGHRPKSLPWGYDEREKSCRVFKKDLKQIFIGAIHYGVYNFMIGMAEGFDMISAEILINLRKTYKYIKIIAVIPCKNQEIKWNIKQQRRYKKILKKCDEQIILSDDYTPTCMFERNKYMVDHSDIVIACYNGNPSGTSKTIKYAKEKGLQIKIINPITYYKYE